LIHFYKRFLPSLSTASQKVLVERRVARKEDMMTSMGWLVKVFMMFTVISTAYSYYDRDQSDAYGRYNFDSYGRKRYSYCYDRDANPRDLCLNYRAGADRYSSYDRYNRYDRDGDYYHNLRGKVNVGRGNYREINGRDAELTCEFPRGSHLISNIVWERVGDKDHYNRGVATSSSLRDYLGRRMQVERIGDYGSVLIIRDWDQRDTGIYRCFATRSYDSGYNYRAGYGRKEAIYMEVDFLPRARTSGSRRGYSDYFSSNRDYYYRDRPYNSRDYGWYRSGVKSEGDTIVIDEKAVKTEKDAKTKE